MCCEYLLPDGFVQLLTSVSRAHGNGYTEVIADRLEYVFCYSLEVLNLPVFGCVIDPKAAVVFDFTTSFSDRFLLNCISIGNPRRINSLNPGVVVNFSIYD